jgi:hypothetical protein
MVTNSHLRSMRGPLITLLAVAAFLAAAAAAASPPELATSNLNTQAGMLAPLRADVTYQASAFPLGLRVTTTDRTWSGTQWKTSSHGKPAFGWAGFGQGRADRPPLGLVEIETAYGPTPTTAAILGRLRTAGGGATFGATSRITLARLPGWQIDGRVFGRFGHVFVPFTAKTGGASPPDSYKLSPGEAFRLVVLDVKGKRVVVIFDSAALPADRFPAFLDSASRFLASLRFG